MKIKKSNIVKVLAKEWWKFDKTITLYHGTHSAFLPSMKKKGLQILTKTKREQVAYLLKKYLKGKRKVTKQLVDRVNSQIRKRKDWTVGNRKLDEWSAIFLTDDLSNAKFYAKRSLFGGEIGIDVIGWIENELDIDIHDEPEGEPIILELELPRSYLKKWIQEIFKKDYDYLKTEWDKKEFGSLSSERKEFKTFEKYLEKMDNRNPKEIRVSKPIPWKHIKKIHKDV